MTKQEEQAIIARVLQGDTDEFALLVKANEKQVYNLALRMLGQEQDALDASQEAFFKAYKALASFRGESRFSVWLYRLTSNVCLDMLRQAGRHLQTQSLTPEEDMQDLPLPDSRYDPQEVLERKEIQKAVQAGLARLPAVARQILVLRDINGLSYEEIGQALQLEAGTVKSRIFRARQKLAAILLADGNFAELISSKEAKNRKGGGKNA